MNTRSKAAKRAWETRRKKKKRLSRRAKKAWKTRRLDWKKLRKGILLVECIPEDYGDCSEGKMLKELFRIIKFQMTDNNESVEVYSKETDSPSELVEILRNAEKPCIHISCHGNHDKRRRRSRRTFLDLDEGKLFADEICSSGDEQLPIWFERDGENKEIPQLVFLSACKTAFASDLCERFMQAGVRYVIGPKKSTSFHEAALFSTVFYTFLYVERWNPYLAFKKIKNAFPKLARNWWFYDAYKHYFRYYDPNGTGLL